MSTAMYNNSIEKQGDQFSHFNISTKSALNTNVMISIEEWHIKK